MSTSESKSGCGFARFD